MNMRVSLSVLIGIVGLMMVMGASASGSVNIMQIVVGVAVMAVAGYLFRGKGAASALDAWESMQHRRAEDQQQREEDQKAQRWKARSDFVATILGRSPTPKISGNDAVAVAQINAVANPETARALQNLQNLLYTQALTDDEFQAAKDMLLRSGGAPVQADGIAQVMKLAELHQAGVLSDFEFQAAKLRALGLG